MKFLRYSVAIVLLLLVVSATLAQDDTPEPTPQSTPTPQEIIVSETTSTIAIGSLIFGGVALLLGMVLAVGLAVKFANYVPLSFAGAYFQTVYGGLKEGDKALNSIKQKTADTPSPIDDVLVEMASKLTEEQIAQFVKIALEKGVILAPPPKTE